MNLTTIYTAYIRTSGDVWLSLLRPLLNVLIFTCSRITINIIIARNFSRQTFGEFDQ